MKFRGTPLSVQNQNRAAWKAWCSQQGQNSALRQFAEAFIADIETRSATDRQIQVRRIIGDAFERAGGGQLTPEQLGEIFLLLEDMWLYGAHARNWAKRQGYWPGKS